MSIVLKLSMSRLLQDLVHDDSSHLVNDTIVDGIPEVLRVVTVDPGLCSVLETRNVAQ